MYQQGKGRGKGALLEELCREGGAHDQGCTGDGTKLRIVLGIGRWMVHGLHGVQDIYHMYTL